MTPEKNWYLTFIEIPLDINLFVANESSKIENKPDVTDWRCLIYSVGC